MTKIPKGKGSTESKGQTRMRAEIVESARDLGTVGLMDPKTVEKITVRMLGPDALPGAVAVSSKQIIAIREQAQMSQAVFARLLSVSTGTLSKWERGEIKPRGPARRLLQIIKARGVGVVC